MPTDLAFLISVATSSSRLLEVAFAGCILSLQMIASGLNTRIRLITQILGNDVELVNTPV